MATKQAKLKEQAYASNLKSRALSILIYLIDRSNQELTCFPAIPTMAEQLHISISTVKRALRELVDAGYISKDAGFREKNRGQSSNLYTLILQEEKQGGNKKDGSGDREKIEQGSDNSCDGKNKDGKDNQDMSKVEGALEKEKVEHINFDGMAGKKEDEKVVESKKKERKKELKTEISNLPKKGFVSLSIRENLLVMRKRIVICIWGIFKIYNRKFDFYIDKYKASLSGKRSKFAHYLLFVWTGEGVKLIPP